MSGADRDSLRRCVVVGGAGDVGSLFADRLTRSGSLVRVVDTAPGPGVLRGDITDIDERLAEELASADMVLLAVPEPVALTAVERLGEILDPTTLLVDTLSVKARFVPAARRALATEALSVNPMFAPSLGIEGRPVAAVVVRDGPKVRDLLRRIESWGGEVVPVDEHEHDRLTGAAQALTHASVLGFGLALRELDVNFAKLDAIAPPPHAVSLALLARVASGTPEVYWDVQAANPHAVRSRTALADGIRRIADVVERGDENGFAEILADVRGVFGDDLEQYREMCARIFEG